MNAYPGGETEPLIPGVPDHPSSITLMGGNLSIRCASYENGHACLNLTRIDLLNHRVITENLGCIHLPSATRRALLTAILEAAKCALLDLDQDTA